MKNILIAVFLLIGLVLADQAAAFDYMQGVTTTPTSVGNSYTGSAAFTELTGSTQFAMGYTICEPSGVYDVYLQEGNSLNSSADIIRIPAGKSLTVNYWEAWRYPIAGKTDSTQNNGCHVYTTFTPVDLSGTTPTVQFHSWKWIHK